MRSLFIIGQINADPLRHRHYKGAVIHIDPVSSTDEFIRGVANERTVGIGRQVRFLVARHKLPTSLCFG